MNGGGPTQIMAAPCNQRLQLIRGVASPVLCCVQVLFSSHHTLHDYPDAKGIQALDGLLQDCKVRGPRDDPMTTPGQRRHPAEPHAVCQSQFS
jgi:hypothetical protein